MCGTAHTAQAWNTIIHTTECMHTRRDLVITAAYCCFDYHPRFHLLAFSPLQLHELNGVLLNEEALADDLHGQHLNNAEPAHQPDRTRAGGGKVGKKSCVCVSMCVCE